MALPGRCSRAQCRRGGRVLPRQVTQTTPGAAGPDLGQEGEAAGGWAAEPAARGECRCRPRRQSLPAGTGGPEHPASRWAGLRSPGRRTRGGAARAERQPRCQPAVRVGVSPPYPAGLRKESGVRAPARPHRPRPCHLPQVPGWSWEDAFLRRRRSGLSGAALRVLLRVRAAWGLGAGAGLCAPAGPVAWGWPREGGSDSSCSGSLPRGDQVSKVLVWFARLGWGMGRSD